MKIVKVKTLDNIQEDMSALYEDLMANKVELKTATGLTNIAGKILKAEQLKLAREIFLSQRKRTGEVAGYLALAG